MSTINLSEYYVACKYPHGWLLKKRVTEEGLFLDHDDLVHLGVRPKIEEQRVERQYKYPIVIPIRKKNEKNYFPSPHLK